jgi:hypothetical protein
MLLFILQSASLEMVLLSAAAGAAALEPMAMLLMSAVAAVMGSATADRPAGQILIGHDLALDIAAEAEAEIEIEVEKVTETEAETEAEIEAETEAESAIETVTETGTGTGADRDHVVTLGDHVLGIC